MTLNKNVKIRLPFTGSFRVTQNFGAKYAWYIKIAGYPHNGIDYATPMNTAIVACDDGEIVYADNTPDADGLGINIKHKWGISQYWHFKRITAKLGAKVKKGEIIGYSGRSGWATGPHLHFGIKVNGDSPSGMRGWTNPANYFGKKVAEPEIPAKKYRYYRVMWGDSLWKIAKKFYGQGGHWPTIYKANLDKIKDPSVIHPFQKLYIP